MFKNLAGTFAKLASSRKAVAATAGGGSAVTLGGAVTVLLICFTELPEEKALMVGAAIATILMWATSTFVKAQGIADAGDTSYDSGKPVNEAENITKKLTEGKSD